MSKYAICYKPLSLKYGVFVGDNILTDNYENALLFSDYNEAKEFMKNTKYCSWTGYYFIVEVENEEK